MKEQREADVAKEKADDMESKAEVEREEARLAKVDAETALAVVRLYFYVFLRLFTFLYISFYHTFALFKDL